MLIVLSLVNIILIAYLFVLALRIVLGWFAPMTLGIYLVHPLFRDVIHQGAEVKAPFLCHFLHFEGWRCMTPNVIVGILGMTILVAIASTGLTLVLRSIPGVRRIIG